MIANAFLIILIVTIVSYVVARYQARAVLAKSGSQMHSRPIYHGLNAAI